MPASEVRDTVRAFEADLLHDQVARAGSIQKAANATGISVSTIKRKLAWRKASRVQGQYPSIDLLAWAGHVRKRFLLRGQYLHST